VSERKRSEQALLDSERHHRTILNTVSEAIFYCNSALKLQFVNPAWTDMTGHGLGTGKSDSLLDYTHPEDIQRVLQARERASGGESSVRGSRSRPTRTARAGSTSSSLHPGASCKCRRCRRA
jgi:PAS domain S-box-containing protein